MSKTNTQPVPTQYILMAAPDLFYLARSFARAVNMAEINRLCALPVFMQSRALELGARELEAGEAAKTLPTFHPSTTTTS